MLAPIGDGGASFARAGYFGSSAERGYSGYYWSSTAETGTNRYKNRYALSVTGSSFNTSIGVDKSVGYSIRCIIKP